MKDPNDSRVLEAAWSTYSVAREKATFATLYLLISTLVPTWSVFDFYLEPDLAPRFLVMRVADVIFTLLVWGYVKRGTDLRKNRLAISACVLGVGFTILPMLPFVDRHYALYTFGFSLVFWGCGLVLIWPLYYLAATFGTLIAVHVAVFVFFPRHVPRGEFVGSLFYIASAIIASGAQLVVRRRLEYEAFRASYVLNARNAELADTLAALGATQARLVAANSVLTESLDGDATGGRVMALAVPTFATWAVLVETRSNGAHTYTCEHVDVASGNALRNALAVSKLEAWNNAALVTECVVDATNEDVSRIAGPGVSAVVTAHSLIAAPLVVRGERTGTLVLGRADRNYERNELAFAEEIAHRAALALDNARLFRETEHAVRLRDEFISIASHELRTPLNPLRMLLATLLRTHPAGDRAHDRLVTADRQVERLTTLVAQLLDVSQLTAGRLALKRENMDFAELVREVAQRFDFDAERADSKIDISGIPGTLIGNWDRSRLDQIVANLLSNAIKYGRGNPIRITLEHADGRARLRVADEGIGIAPSNQARIFQRFERAVPSSNYGGFGLGLWIVRLLVEGQGGTVRLESALERGSTFTVELPVSSDAS